MNDTATSTALATLDPPGTNGQLDTFAQAERAWPLAERLAKSPEFVPKGMLNRPEAVLAVMLRGHELTIPPMVALAQMHVVDGRVGLSAELLRALVLRAGHELWPQDISNTRVTMCARRSGTTGDPIKVTWTLDDAKTANLVGKDNWRKYPRAMLTARATAEIVRLVFPDVIGGLQAIEELWDIDGESWEEPSPGELEPPAAPQTTRKAAGATARPRKKAAPRTPAATAAPSGPPLPPLPHELDDEPVDAEIVTPEPEAADDAAPVDDLAARRAQQIAMKCNGIGIDRADLIYAVTGGRTTSAKEVTADEATAVLEAIRLIKVGEKGLDTSGDEPRLVDIDRTAAAEAELGAGGWADTIGQEHTWTADTWRSYLSEHGLKVVAVIKEAQAIAKQQGEPLPGNLDGLHGSESLCGLLRSWCEDQIAGGTA